MEPGQDREETMRRFQGLADAAIIWSLLAVVLAVIIGFGAVAPRPGRLRATSAEMVAPPNPSLLPGEFRGRTVGEVVEILDRYHDEHAE
jgi:hypothetical protein